MDNFAERFAALTPEQRELLALRLKKKGLDLLGKDEPDAVLSAGSTQADPLPEGQEHVPATDRRARQALEFSLFYFSGDGSQLTNDKYRLLLEGAKFADQNGFSAVWTPERHFQQFGGLYPNPAVIAAALAMITERIHIRAGSVVMPLHNPLRVAEEWSVVDNLSGGRAGISVATGGHPIDFVLDPSAYENRREIMFRDTQLLQSLWSGATVRMPGGGGHSYEVGILPKPVQERLPIWVTSSGNPKTWVKAGEMGANVLAGLIGNTVEDIETCIILYRQSLTAHGHDPQTGRVTVMMHTFLGDDLKAVKEQVRGPLSNYLHSYIRPEEVQLADLASYGIESFTEEHQDMVVSFAFERFFNFNGLLGTVDKCLPLIDRLAAIGVDEIACQVDFGLDAESMMKSFQHLNELRKLYS